MSDTNWIVGFHEPVAERSGLGGKGECLNTMTALGLPVPPGFTVLTNACGAFFSNDKQWPEGLADELSLALAELEQKTGLALGSDDFPLFLSVRSGAETSMPGMMDTLLNIGINDKTVESLAKSSGNPVFAWDTYRRFIEMFADVVLNIHFSRLRRAQENAVGTKNFSTLDLDGHQALVDVLKGVIADCGRTFPQEPSEQLRLAIDAVFGSYNNHRARYYRKMQGIAEGGGTAVNVQQMVFGNISDSSCTGVVFTRDPKTGQNGLIGEWLPKSQGEDVVAGIRTPNAFSEGEGGGVFADSLPEAYKSLLAARSSLETHYKEMLEIEFTVENGDIYFLQARPGKRTTEAALRIVVDLCNENFIDQTTALMRIEPESLEHLLRPTIVEGTQRKVIATGIDASAGAATGQVVFSTEECREFQKRDIPTILVRSDTSPEDIQGMNIADGFLTARGGQTSHAAVVARSMGKPCVVGCSDIQVDYGRQVFYAGDTVVKKGEYITIDGSTGEVLEGKVETSTATVDNPALTTLLSWADDRALVKVRANTDSAVDAARAREMGAVGLGLCRTEHMFFQEDGLLAIRRAVLAEGPRARRRALNDILPLQRNSFKEILQAMEGLPVSIRLLDPPLLHFLPGKDEDVSRVAEELGVRISTIQGAIKSMEEVNPVHGHRGVRICISTPEIYRTQVRALFEAACELTSKGVQVLPEIVIPLVSLESEVAFVRALIIEEAEAVIAEYGCGPDYTIGCMIELPRACLIADKIAQHADFFSFGTNDLTQSVYGMSRDDIGHFLPDYQRAGLLKSSPLTELDTDGVGAMLEMAAEKGRKANPSIEFGTCGEHCGTAKGVAFFHKLGLNYVSCSPYKVPVARLAAAQAAIRTPK